jgi:hypothetical protein
VTENPNLSVLKTLPFCAMHFKFLRNDKLWMLFPLIADVGVSGVPTQIVEVNVSLIHHLLPA